MTGSKLLNSVRTLVHAQKIRLKQRVRTVVRKKRFQLISQSRAAELGLAVSAGILRPEERVMAPGPRFIGTYDYDLEEERLVELPCPKSEVFRFSNVHVLGSSSLIFKDTYAVHNDLANPDKDMFTIELRGEAEVDAKGEMIEVVHHGATLNLDRGISLLGECNGNYAHWLIETLPKLVLIDEHPEFAGWPLIVDGWIHPVFFDTLRLLNTSARKVIRVEQWQKVVVKDLVTLTPPSYTAPEDREQMRSGRTPAPLASSYPMSRLQFSAMRDKAAKAARKFILGSRDFVPAPANIYRVFTEDGATAKVAIHKPTAIRETDTRVVTAKYVYLRRTAVSSGNPRSIKDVEKVEAVLADHGFLAVDPAQMSFPEQVMLLSQAEIVVSAVGAALANALFAPPGLKVIALSPYYLGADYYYFSNMMAASGHDLYYVLGPQVERPGTHWQHHDFMIDLSALQEALERLGCPRNPVRPVTPRPGRNAT